MKFSLFLLELLIPVIILLDYTRFTCLYIYIYIYTCTYLKSSSCKVDASTCNSLWLKSNKYIGSKTVIHIIPEKYFNHKLCM